MAQESVLILSRSGLRKSQSPIPASLPPALWLSGPDPTPDPYPNPIRYRLLAEHQLQLNCRSVPLYNSGFKPQHGDLANPLLWEHLAMSGDGLHCHKLGVLRAPSGQG